MGDFDQAETGVLGGSRSALPLGGGTPVDPKDGLTGPTQGSPALPMNTGGDAGGAERVDTVKGVKFYTKDTDAGWVISVENTNPDVMVITIGGTPVNAKSSKTLPFKATLEANAPKTEVFDIKIIDTSKQASDGITDLDAQAGDPNATHDGALCELPFASGKTFKCLQGFGGAQSHQGENAIDFAMPLGTSVLCARAGIVTQVKKDSDQGGADASFEDKANLVVVLHSDHTYGEYVHLKKDGASVNAGSKVKVGDEIGKSGNTGFSAEPHLHFAVVKADGKGGFKKTDWKFKNAQGQGFVPNAGDMVTK